MLTRRLSLIAVAAAFAVSSSAAMLQSARPALADADDHHPRIHHRYGGDRNRDDRAHYRTWNNGGNRNWNNGGTWYANGNRNWNNGGTWYANGNRNWNNNGNHNGWRKHHRDRDRDRR